MKMRAGRPAALLAAALLMALSMAPAAAARGDAFHFGVIGHSFKAGPDEAALRQAIRETDQADLAFVVATGIKAGAESCGDKLYARRMDLLNASARPMVVSLAASDWSACKNSLGKSDAIDRLNRLRELFFADDNSLGARKITLARLSSSAQFRSYAENAHWQSGRILFATINLPANNNHYRPEAGRNSEFEDRLVANRNWLLRLFAMAQRKKLDGIVLFSDGDAGVLATEKALLAASGAKQDGFAGTRRQLKTLAKKFPGKVLLIDTQGRAGAAAIAWKDNLGHLGVGASWVDIEVGPASAGPVFELAAPTP